MGVVRLSPRLGIGVVPMAARAGDADRVGGLGPEAFWQKTEKVAAETVGGKSLAELDQRYARVDARPPPRRAPPPRSGSTPVWASDHSDNDGSICNSSIGNVSDNPNATTLHGYACCGTSRTSITCPAPAFEVGGVCVAKVMNSDSYSFNTAATACAGLGARLCSMSQTAVLRSMGTVTSSSSWTASHSDNAGATAAVAVGNAGDNPNDSDSYGYACCL